MDTVRIIRTGVLLMLLSGCTWACPAGAKKVKTTLKVEKRDKKAKATSSQDGPTRRVDAGTESILDLTDEGSLKFIADSVKFYGYDKQLNARKETLFIKNANPWPMREVEVEITYRDMQGRMLHRRKVNIKCNVPAGETRRAEFSSWDTQNDFYYFESTEPRREATPYRIDFTPQTYIIPVR